MRKPKSYKWRYGESFSFLESTLELLQQFYIQVESVDQDCKVFPGDQSTFSLKCCCCGKRITSKETPANLLLMAPIAICYHLKMLPASSIVNEPPSSFRKLPVLFTSKENYFESKCAFEIAIYKIAGDETKMNFSTQKTVVPIKI
jgi:hypothetical protein